MADNDKPGLKIGSWSKEEDAKQVANFKKYGHSDWRRIPKFAGRIANDKKIHCHTLLETLDLTRLPKFESRKRKLSGVIITTMLEHPTNVGLQHTHLKKRLDFGEMASEFMVKHSNTFEGEMNHYAETENSVIFGDASSNNSESSITPLFTEKTDVEQEDKSLSTMNWPGKNTCSEDSSHIPINGASQDSSLKTINGANGGNSSSYSDGRTDSEGGSGPS